MDTNTNIRQPRTLDDHEKEKLDQQQPASEFKVIKLEREARKNWDKFYHRNTDNFFKDRHWSREDLVELCPHINMKDPLVFVEAGCGVGNMLFPLIQYFPSWELYGFDFSDKAIGLLKDRASEMDGVKLKACVADLCDSTHFPPPMLTTGDISPEKCPSSIVSPKTEQVNNPDHSACSKSEETPLPTPNIFPPSNKSTQTPPPPPIPNTFPSSFPGSDLTTLIFVLSAIDPSKHGIAVSNLSKVIKKEGTVIVRDYGVNDHAMVRFGRGAKLGERFYARQDGTRAYYFQLEELEALFLTEGFSVLRSEYLSRRTINHAKKLSVDRVFVQSVFIKNKM